MRSDGEELVISLQTDVECFSLGSCLHLGHVTGQLSHVRSQCCYTLRVTSGGRDPQWWKGFPGGCHLEISLRFVMLNQKGRRKILTQELTQSPGAALRIGNAVSGLENLPHSLLCAIYLFLFKLN